MSGSLSVDWVTGAKTAFEDLANANTPTSLAVSFTGPTIAATHKIDLTFKLPGVFFNATNPAISGPDVTTVDYAYDWRYDGVNVPAITLMSTDIAL
jgi:hypothetical protein